VIIFGLVWLLYKKKITKTGFFEKKLKPVQIDQLDFFQFGSVFSGLA
jgi:hypothetical protein